MLSSYPQEEVSGCFHLCKDNLRDGNPFPISIFEHPLGMLPSALLCFGGLYYRMESRCNQSPGSLSRRNTTLEEGHTKSTLALVFCGSSLFSQLFFFFKDTSTCFGSFEFIVLHLLVLLPQLLCEIFQGKKYLLFLIYLLNITLPCGHPGFISTTTSDLLVHQNNM